MELTATSATAANILSLINLLGDSSIASTSQSTSFPQAFSALLTEMMGPTAGQPSIDPKAVPVQLANVTPMPVPSALSTSSGPSQQPVEWAAASTNPTTTSPPMQAAAAISVVHEPAVGVDPIKEAWPLSTSVAATKVSNPRPLPVEPQQDLLQQAIGGTNLDTSLPSQTAPAAKAISSGSVSLPAGSKHSAADPEVAADPTIVVASEPSAGNAAVLEKSTTGVVNERTSLADSTKGRRSEAAPGATVISSGPFWVPSGPQQSSTGQPAAPDPAIVIASEPSAGNAAVLDKSPAGVVNGSPTAPTITELVPNSLEPKIASAQEPAQIANRALSGVAQSVQTVTLSPDPISDTSVQTGETPKTVAAGKPATSDKAAPATNIVVPLVPFLHFAVSLLTVATPVADSKSAKLDQPPAEPQPVFQVVNPEMARAFADVKRFDVTVQPEVSTTSTVPAGQKESILQDQPSKMAFVTTDPVKNLTQQQLPPRIMPVLKVVPEAKQSDRSKPSAASGSALIATAPAGHPNDLVRPVEYVDQAPAAHTIEIPNIPHLPVVRIVSMQVGEADSEITIRIQQREGNLTLQLNANNDQLHQNLQSSVGSLAQALKLENVPVSGIEVSRKPLTDKVRRMKETH